MIKYLTIILILLFLSCRNQNKSVVDNNIDSTEFLYDTFRTNVLKLDTGWGYEISINSKTYIQQTIIPAIEGRYTFGSPEDAKKTANFVVEKMLNNFFPPSVDENELDSLGVLTKKILITD